jgi:hypothetical protein
VRKEESERLGGVVVWLLEEKEAVWLLASEARPGAAASCCLAAWWARPAWVGVRLCAKRPEAQRNRSTSLPRSLPFDETPVEDGHRRVCSMLLPLPRWTEELRLTIPDGRPARQISVPRPGLIFWRP